MTRLIHAFLALLTCSIFACSHADRPSSQPQTGGDPSTIVLVVRHAEKANLTDPNTDLAPDSNKRGFGVSRAESLKDSAVAAGVSVVYTSEFCRTAQTVQPAAQALGLSLNVLADTKDYSTLTDCSPAISTPLTALQIPLDDFAAIADAVRTQHRAHTVLIAGHTNTVPGIVEALTGVSLCPTYFPLRDGACEIPEERFGDLFRVSIPAGSAKPSLSHEQF